MEVNEVKEFKDIAVWLAWHAEDSSVLGYWQGFWQGIRQVFIERGLAVIPVEQFELSPEPLTVEIEGVSMSAYHLRFFMGDGVKGANIGCAFIVNAEGRIASVAGF